MKQREEETSRQGGVGGKGNVVVCIARVARKWFAHSRVAISRFLRFPTMRNGEPFGEDEGKEESSRSAEGIGVQGYMRG